MTFSEFLRSNSSKTYHLIASDEKSTCSVSVPVYRSQATRQTSIFQLRLLVLFILLVFLGFAFLSPPCRRPHYPLRLDWILLHLWTCSRRQARQTPWPWRRTLSLTFVVVDRDSVHRRRQPALNSTSPAWELCLCKRN